MCVLRGNCEHCGIQSATDYQHAHVATIAMARWNCPEEIVSASSDSAFWFHKSASHLGCTQDAPCTNPWVGYRLEANQKGTSLHITAVSHTDVGTHSNTRLGLSATVINFFLPLLDLCAPTLSHRSEHSTCGAGSLQIDAFCFSLLEGSVWLSCHTGYNGQPDPPCRPCLDCCSWNSSAALTLVHLPSRPLKFYFV